MVDDPVRLSAPRAIRPGDGTAGFHCGEPWLDDWMVRRALQNERAGGSRTFVVCEGQVVRAYYSLAATSISHDISTTGVRRNMPDPVPAALLGRLAVDRTLQGRGLGSDLLADAVKRVSAAASGSASGPFSFMQFPRKQPNSIAVAASAPLPFGR